MTLPAFDWSMTNRSQAQRETKVYALWTFCFAAGISAADLEQHDDQRTRRRISLKADVRPSKPGGRTWPATIEALRTAEAWAELNPLVAQERRTLTHLRAELLGLGPTTAPTVPAPRSACLVPFVPREQWPKGWSALAALGPFEPPQLCGIDDCGAPGITRVLPRHPGERDFVLCADHPPIGTQWGAQLDWTPKHCNQPLRCYCGRCPGIPLEELPADTDDRTTLDSLPPLTKEHHPR